MNENSSEVSPRLARLTYMVHLLLSQLEIHRGYGGDLPPSPYLGMLDELERYMEEDGTEFGSHRRPFSQRIHTLDLPAV